MTRPTDVIIAPGVEFNGTHRFTSWEQDQAQRAQIERARRIRAEREAEQRAEREACLRIIEHPNAGLEPPDGGAPTPDEMLANIATAIRERPL